MMVMYYASGIIDYDKGIPELSNAPLHNKVDTNSIENSQPPYDINSPGPSLAM